MIEQPCDMSRHFFRQNQYKDPYRSAKGNASFMQVCSHADGASAAKTLP